MWNYRIVHDSGDDTGEGYEIAEVFYDEDGKIEGYGEASMYGETEEELRQVYEMMAEAFTKPVVRYDRDGKLMEP